MKTLLHTPHLPDHKQARNDAVVEHLLKETPKSLQDMFVAQEVLKAVKRESKSMEQAWPSNDYIDTMIGEME